MDPALVKPLDLIEQGIRGCRACTARDEARWPVAGVGAYRAGVLFVGRNPGQDEDQGGEPFIGAAGRVLDEFLAAAGLTRQDIYLTNLVCCHTFKDRVPKKPEIATCAKLHLRPTLTLLRPWLVVTFGAEAALALGRVGQMARNHGEIYQHAAGFILVTAYHPAAPLHNPKLRGAITYDAMQVRRVMQHQEAYRAQLAAAQPAGDRAE